MSGRILASLVVLGCIAMVLVALSIRSRDTSQVRAFWTPEGAAVIQRAKLVEVMREGVTNETVNGEDSTDQLAWRDISTAQGLVHLRATLVDDRFFQWETLEQATKPDQSSELASKRIRFRFRNNEETTELAIDLASGFVVNLKRGQQVQLIDSSRQAIAEYLQRLLGPTSQ